jgi:hypothetical protein
VVDLIPGGSMPTPLQLEFAALCPAAVARATEAVRKFVRAEKYSTPMCLRPTTGILRIYYATAAGLLNSDFRLANPSLIFTRTACRYSKYE